MYLCVVISKQININTMTTFNTQMTIEEATNLYTSKSGMQFPNTEHNRVIMAQVIKNHLSNLQGK